MKILIYIKDVTRNNGGIFHYATTVLHILSGDEDNFYYVYYDENDDEMLAAIKGLRNHLLVRTADLGKGKTVYPSILIRAINLLFRKTQIKRRIMIKDDLSFFCLKNGIDVVYSPYQFAPIVENSKVIFTLHDVQELHFPEFFSPEERSYRAVYYYQFIKTSDHIIVSYDHIKSDIIKYFKADEKKISVILLDIDNLWFKKYLGHEPRNISYLNLPEDYLFYPANTWPHKNHLNLIKAVAQLRDEGKQVNVVFSGQQNSHFENIKTLIDELQLDKQLIFLGLVAEDELHSLYKNATAVVIPTMYEAGSFPLMESFFLGKPVICSNVTSLPETIGDKRFIFNPLDIGEMKDRLSKIYFDRDYREAALMNSNQRKSYLQNLNSLGKLKSVFNNNH